MADSALIGQDLWKQLKRVSIPVFSGDKRTYSNWKAAFLACVDQAPATPEYKLLQLRQCLAGEALKTIESLGHSAAAYQAAKERLERKFGGQRRQIAIYLEEIDSFKPVRPGNYKDIEKFADLLDVAIVNLKETHYPEELRDGMLYIKLQKKLPTQMLAAYHRWVFENYKIENVEVLREWIVQEAEFQMRAIETVQGLSTGRHGKPETRSHGFREPHQTFFGRSNAKLESGESRGQRSCRVCNKQHGTWTCDEFKQLNIQKRWECAKRLRLCFRCLGKGHLGQCCTRTRVCGLNGCKELHHRLLHRNPVTLPDNVEESQRIATNKRSTVKVDQPLTTEASKYTQEERVPVTRVDSPREGDQVTSTQNTTMVSGISSNIALRTIPVFVRNGHRKLMVNALLDDASTKTYLNTDVASELGLKGKLQRINVNVLNSQVETFETSPVELLIESLDGNTTLKVTALTTSRVTRNMKVIDWVECAGRWPHLKNIEFQKLGPRPIVDVLIGLDCSDLHFSFRDVRGEPGQPVARLTPPGWTCIGPVYDEGQACMTNFARTYFTTGDTDVSKIEAVLQKFWEVDSCSGEVSFLSPQDKLVLEKTKKSIQFVDSHYRISIPWKGDSVYLPDNYSVAVNRLKNLEKRLAKNPEVARSYQETIEQHLEKGYIRQVNPSE